MTCTLPKTNGATTQTYTKETKETYKYLICRIHNPQEKPRSHATHHSAEISTPYSAGLVRDLSPAPSTAHLGIKA